MKKRRNIEINIAKAFHDAIESRTDDRYINIAVYMVIVSLRDLTYEGKNKHMLIGRKKAIAWFKKMDHNVPFGFGEICTHIGVDAERMWLQIRRLYKNDREYLVGSLKSIESSIFSGYKLLNIQKTKEYYANSTKNCLKVPLPDIIPVEDLYKKRKIK